MTSNPWKRAVAALTALPLTALLLSPAVPVTFDWGSFSASGLLIYGVYDNDNITPLQTGDLAQLIWAGPNGRIDDPQPNGSPGGDDQALDTHSVQNGAPLPPPTRNKGYVPFKTYTFDSTSPLNNGVVYIRAWNATDVDEATAYGNSSVSLLVAGATFNALRWYTDVTWSIVPGQTSTLSPTLTSNPTTTGTSTSTTTPTDTSTPTRTATATASSAQTASPTVTSTPTNTTVATVTPSITDVPSVTHTPTPTATASATETPVSTLTLTSTPTGAPTGHGHFLPLVLHR